MNLSPRLWGKFSTTQNFMFETSETLQRARVAQATVVQHQGTLELARPRLAVSEKHKVPLPSHGGFQLFLLLGQNRDVGKTPALLFLFPNAASSSLQWRRSHGWPHGTIFSHNTYFILKKIFKWLSFSTDGGLRVNAPLGTTLIINTPLRFLSFFSETWLLKKLYTFSLMSILTHLKNNRTVKKKENPQFHTGFFSLNHVSSFPLAQPKGRLI